MRRVGIGSEKPEKKNNLDAKLRKENRELKEENAILKDEISRLRQELQK